MIILVQTDSDDRNFIKLVQQLDAYLAVIDGEDHAFYDQYNKTDTLKYVMVAYEDGTPIGCGAMKPLDSKTVEVKRMYTTPESRGKGIATAILDSLEGWSTREGYRISRLETGIRQSEAIALYKKAGYQIIPNYGQYAGVVTSVCFEKQMPG